MAIEVEIPVDGAPMPAHVILPDVASGTTPGVIVCMHAPGVDGFILDILDRLGDGGFAAVAPDLYHRQPSGPEAASRGPLERMALLRDREVVRDLAATAAWLRGQPAVDPRRTGVIGFCMGGRIAWLMATHDPALRAAVVFYGGSIGTAWADAGEAAESPFDRGDRIACPVLGLFGREDTNPSPEDVARLDAELTRLGVTHELVSYDGAGHAFLNASRPSHRPEAAADAWRRCVEWLRRYVAEG